MNYKTTVRYIFPLFFLVAVACSSPERPVTKKEAAALADSLKVAVAQHNTNRFNELLDLEAFEKRIMAHAHNKLDPSIVAGAMKGIRAGEFGQQIAKVLDANGTYELVKQYEKDNQQHLIFRLYKDQINYHDFELIKKNGEVKIADIFIYFSGEKLSATLAESLQSLDEASERTTGKSDKDAAKKVRLIKNYVNANEFEKANQLFKKLPAAIREQKLYRMVYIQIAGGLGNDQYLAALNEFQQQYPDAPNMYLLLLDAYFLKKDFAGSLRCVNSLDSLINKDPFLDYYRALICKQSGDTANKLVYLERLHQNLPGFASGTVELINTYLENEQWDKAVPLTREYKKSKGADTTTLAYLYVIYPDLKEKMEAGDQR